MNDAYSDSAATTTDGNQPTPATATSRAGPDASLKAAAGRTNEQTFLVNYRDE
jgi:hypothetical protein